MIKINPHVNFNGNAEEAFTFYKSVFGGEFNRIIRFRDMEGSPFADGHPEANKILHIALPIGNTSLMANDVPEFMGRVSENENRSKIFVAVDSKQEVDRIFTGLSAGGTVEGPAGDSPWGTYFAMFRDKYGIEWMVEFNPSDQK